ncbi:hypothetical protein DOTSEDRAFT_152803 [Dothistroma septosporum NZE10]|uniref:G-patch domain-containing protein n=1 Tax=Dothistroma septosporum (strain NZE10 / CBS 128990) TaxID=675120 RepID=N1PPB5_DOTSN|nr:hypothetical protein DOTSEDRAFT_152803 [Dothistroma septosporum NZE10]
MFKPTNLGKKNAKPAPKPKPTFASAHKNSSSVSTGPSSTTDAPERSSTPQQQPQPPPLQQQQSQKRGFNDWLANEDEEWEYYEKPRHGQSGKNKKKKKSKQVQEQAWSWDDLYDPSLPVNFLEYPKSDAYYEINEAWKQRLYDARRRERRRKGQDTKRSYSDEDMPDAKSRPRGGMQFAPPSHVDFAPPTASSSDHASRPTSAGPLRDYDRPKAFSPPAVQINQEETAEEAYARRMALSEKPVASQSAVPSPPVQAQSSPISAPMPTPVAKPLSAEAEEKRAKAAAQIAAIKAKMAAKTGSPAPATASPQPGAPAATTPQSNTPHVSAAVPPPPHPEPQQPSLPTGTISAAPTFNLEYYASTAGTDEVASASETVAEDPDAPRSRAPGQAGFAERLMAKMGYQKGQGLGADGSGITTAIVMKAEKRKKKSDAEGGGYVAPANMGKIVGGKKKKTENAESETDAMSEVIKLEGMLANMDVDKEIQDNNLMQEVGDELGEFGKVERLFIWRKNAGGNDEVFVKFTSPLSALRAVREMDGVEFADNVVKAAFFDVEKFEKGEYV